MSGSDQLDGPAPSIAATPMAPSMSGQTMMSAEARQAPDAVRLQLSRNQGQYRELVRCQPLDKLRLIMTCARGSSDHAATYGKYLMETMLGLPVSSAPPSIASLYHVKMDLRGVLFLIVSQSGKSPDLVKNAHWARENGAFVVSLINDDRSPVAEASDLVLPLMAGEEVSVAATKSFIGSLSAFALLVAAYSQDKALNGALSALPDHLEAANGLDWTPVAPWLAANNNIITIGRGLSYGVAHEAALKLKETSAIHAEAFSSAEVRHGPLGLLRDNLPFVIFSQKDACRADIDGLALDLLKEKARIFLADEDAPPARPPAGGAGPASGTRTALRHCELLSIGQQHCAAPGL